MSDKAEMKSERDKVLSQIKKPRAKKMMDEDIASMKRSDIRYALYRCKNDNPEPAHKSIYKYYTTQLDDFGFDAFDFAEDTGWDVNKKDFTEIVTGKTVRKYIKELLAPSFSL